MIIEGNVAFEGFAKMSFGLGYEVVIFYINMVVPIDKLIIKSTRKSYK